MGERVADHLRLLVNLLGHEVAVIALLDQQAAGLAPDLAPRDDGAGSVVKHRALAGQHDPVALFEIGDQIGEGRERQRVRAKIHLAGSVAHGERRALTGADQQVFLSLEQERQRIGAAHPRQRSGYRFDRALASRQLIRDEKGRDFAVRLGFERIALARQFFTQRLEIFYYSVVHDRNFVARMRMGVGFVGFAVRRPPCMPDADRT